MLLSLCCCFAITSTTIEFILMHKDKCANLLKSIKENKCHPEYLSMCNFIYDEAKTRDFHQELNSSYTFITVPQWNYNSLFSPKELEAVKNEKNKEKEKYRHSNFENQNGSGKLYFQMDVKAIKYINI